MADEPIVGTWYEDLETGRVFQVLDYTASDDVIDIQYDDGSIDEISMDEWEEMELESTDEPEDWDELMEDSFESDEDEY